MEAKPKDYTREKTADKQKKITTTENLTITKVKERKDIPKKKQVTHQGRTPRPTPSLKTLKVKAQDTLATQETSCSNP